MAGKLPVSRFGPISPAAAGPLYEQIVVGVKREVAAGRLKPGETLPSVRGLAAELLVSLITVTRAYEELEREGIIYLRQGLGSFVADAEQTRQLKRQTTRDSLRTAIASSRESGMNDKELFEMLKKELSEGAVREQVTRRRTG